MEKPSVLARSASYRRTLANTYETHAPNYWSNSSANYSEYTWTNRGKIVDARRTNSYVLNSGDTELNLAKFLLDVQKWLSINLLKSKLRYFIFFERPEQRFKAVNLDVCKKLPKLIGYHNHVPWATAKRTSVV